MNDFFVHQPQHKHKNQQIMGETQRESFSYKRAAVTHKLC